MKEIALANGRGVAIVDDGDYERVAEHRWCLLVTGALRYAISGRWKAPDVYMHRLITDAPKGLVVDHVNHDGLDNQRANLRLCTHAQNLKHSRKRVGWTSRYHGVCFTKQQQKWRVDCGGYVGLFSDEISAALAYDVVAKKKHGEFASLNFPDGLAS